MLSIFLGMFGADRFYLGHPAIGLLKFSTLGFFFLGHLLDIVLIASQVVGPADGSHYVISYFGAGLSIITGNEETAKKVQSDWFWWFSISVSGARWPSPVLMPNRKFVKKKNRQLSVAKNKHKSVRLVFDDLFSNMKHWILNNTNTDRQQCIAYMQFLPYFLNYYYLKLKIQIRIVSAEAIRGNTVHLCSK